MTKNKKVHYPCPERVITAKSYSDRQREAELALVLAIHVQRYRQTRYVSFFFSNLSA